MLIQNITNIHNRISEKCLEIKRSENEIIIVAVSKQSSAEAITEAKKNGMNNFGENKAHELKQKYEILPTEIKWHFIGHLQTNKVKDVVPIAYLIHSVETIKLAKEIAKRAKNIEKVQNVLIEINTSKEESKFGLRLDEEISELAEFCQESDSLNLQGLMTMAPFTKDENIIRNSFRSLKEIFLNLNSKGYKLSQLSMGMTNDFEIAIEEGATILRIGTAIFGSKY